MSVISRDIIIPTQQCPIQPAHLNRHPLAIFKRERGKIPTSIENIQLRPRLRTGSSPRLQSPNSRRYPNIRTSRLTMSAPNRGLHIICIQWRRYGCTTFKACRSNNRDKGIQEREGYTLVHKLDAPTKPLIYHSIFSLQPTKTPSRHWHSDSHAFPQGASGVLPNSYLL